MADRGLLRWACIIAAVVLAFIWLLAATVAGFSAPGWVGPAAVLATAIALVL